MAARLSVQIAPLKLPLVGVNGVDVLIDGQPAAAVDFGQSVSLDLEPGTRGVAVSLRGVIVRRSNTIILTVADGDQATLTGKYSRLWGTFKLTMS